MEYKGDCEGNDDGNPAQPVQTGLVLGVQLLQHIVHFMLRVFDVDYWVFVFDHEFPPLPGYRDDW